MFCSRSFTDLATCIIGGNSPDWAKPKEKCLRKFISWKLLFDGKLSHVIWDALQTNVI